MNGRLEEITRRRTILVARAAAERAKIGQVMQAWQTPLALAASGISLARALRAHPFAILLGIAVLIRMRHRGLSVWIERIWAGWRLYHSLRKQ